MVGEQQGMGKRVITRVHGLGLVAAHLRTLGRGGGQALRWRLETYGLYMPSYPHQRPWWAINHRVALVLARRVGRYQAWLEEMDALRGGGPAREWAERLEPGDQERWRCWLSAQNAPELESDGQDGGPG